MSIKAPFLPYDKLRIEAEEFLSENHPDRTIPVPIEFIVDVEFEIDIVATPGLLDHFDIDAFITSDFGTIYVDKGVHDHSSKNRYRFSLAYELSHYLIHEDIFAELNFSTITEWKAVSNEIPPEEYSWIETQAYALAGLILVPQVELKDVFGEVSRTASGSGVDLSVASDEARGIVESHIGRRFEVSRDVIQRRTKADGLWNEL